jgi:hypothetical protein
MTQIKTWKAMVHARTESGEAVKLPYVGRGSSRDDAALSIATKARQAGWHHIHVLEVAPLYCEPWNAGLASETPAVCKRLGRLLTALDTEINSHVVQGDIIDHIRDFRFALMTRLEAEGWTMGYDGGNHMKVRDPNHKRPFDKRIKGAA